MVLAVISVTLMSAQAKLIGTDYDPIQIAFIRAIIVMILLSPIIYKLGGVKFLKTKKPFLHFFRSIAGVIGNVLFFYSFQRLPIADVTVISMAVPIFSSILALIILNEIIGWRRWTAIMFGFLGVIIALDPSINMKFASITALLATLMWSITIIFLRILGSTEHPVKTVFYFMFVSFLEASIVSPFNYTGIIWAIIFDLLIWNVLPVTSTIIGGLIITISGIYIFNRETKSLKRKF